jgi:hypothetical protein
MSKKGSSISQSDKVSATPENIDYLTQNQPVATERKLPSVLPEQGLELSQVEGVATAEQEKAARILREYRPGQEEEQQTALVAGVSDVIAPYNKGVGIDQNSLIAKDAVDKCNEAMRRGTMPTDNYPSNVGYYGFDVLHDGNRTIYSQSGFGKLMLAVEKWFYKKRDSGTLFGRSLREKLTGSGHPSQIIERVKKLGQQQYFSLNDDGQLEEDNADLRSGASLDDLLRFQDRQESNYQFIRDLKGKIDDALVIGTRTIQKIHETSNGGIGEVLCNDLVLQVEGGEVIGARLTLPDTRYQEDVDALEQKATDLSDLCFSAGSAAFQVGGEAGGETMAQRYIGKILSSYDDDMVKTALRSLVKSRPAYGYFTNRPRLGFDRVENPREAFERVRAIIIELLTQSPPQLPAKSS